jgi:hypothetical protein
MVKQNKLVAARVLGSLFLLAALAPLASAQTTQSQPATAPSLDEPAVLLARLKPAHPRLLITPEWAARMNQRAENDPELRGLIDRLVARADALLKVEPVQGDLDRKDKRVYPAHAQVFDRVTLLGVAYHLRKDPRHAQRAIAELMSSAAQKDWNPGHFLTTAIQASAVGMGLDWFDAELTEEQKATITRSIVENGMKPALECYELRTIGGWWTTCNHNWNQVCNGGLMIAAMSIAEREPKIAGEVFGAAVRRLPVAMARYAPDGAWNEGISYWAYGTSNAVTAIAALKTATGSEGGITEIPGVELAGLFPLAMAGPTGRMFNFSDGHDAPMNHPCMLWLGERYGKPAMSEPRLRELRKPGAQAMPLDLLWLPEDWLSPAPPADLPLGLWMRRADVMTLRTSWTDNQALFVGIKAGSNRANHSHLDLGSFIFEALGQRWANDPGSESYAVPGYFDFKFPWSTRWTYYRVRAEGHNTLVINPDDKPDQDIAGDAKVVKFDGGDVNKMLTVMDLTKPYVGRAKSVQRGVALLDQRRLLVRDEVTLAEPDVGRPDGGEVWWFMTTLAQAQVADTGKIATLTLGEQSVEVRLIEPENAVLSVMPAVPLPSSPKPVGQSANERLRKLAVHLTGVTKPATIVVLITPSIKGGQALGEPDLAKVVLEKW